MDVVKNIIVSKVGRLLSGEDGEVCPLGIAPRIANGNTLALSFTYIGSAGTIQ